MSHPQWRRKTCSVKKTVQSCGPRNTLGSSELEYFLSPRYVRKEIDICADLLNILGVDGLRMLCEVPKKYLSSCRLAPQAAGKVKLQNPKSSYVCSCLPPTLSSPRVGDSITVSDQVAKTGKRVVASSCFCGSEKCWFDNVMVASSKLNSRTVCQSCNKIVWFAKVHEFIRPCHETKSAGDIKQNDKNSKTIQDSQAGQLCLVQWYKILSRMELLVDQIDKVLDYVRIRLQRVAGEAKRLSSGRKFCPIPVGSIKGIVHLVRRDQSLYLASKNYKWSAQHEQITYGETGWLEEAYYVNHFIQIR